MATLISGAGLIFDYAIEGIGTVGNAILDTPVLTLTFGCGIAFVAVTLLARLLRFNA